MIRMFVIWQTFLTMYILYIKFSCRQPFSPNSDMSKEQPPTEAVAPTRHLISHFHRWLRFNTFLQRESALKEVQPFSISTLILHREAKSGCLVKFTYVGQTVYSLEIRVILKVAFQTVQNERFDVLKWRSYNV
jgi:hypothetical protein